MKAIFRSCAILLGLLPAMGDAFTPQPGFDLLWAAGTSELIVRGRFEADESFTVSQTIYGVPPEDGIIKLKNTQWVVTYLNVRLRVKESPEVILFLGHRYHDLFFVVPTNVVAFDDSEATWASLDDWSMAGNSFQRHPAGSKERFMALLGAALDDLKQLREIVAKPRSAERVEELVSFLRNHWADVLGSAAQPSPRPGWGWRGSFYLAQLCEALREHPTTVELDALLRAVESSTGDFERAAFICAIQSVASGNQVDPSVFDRVKRWVQRGNTWLTREAAFSAVVTLDYQRGIDLLTPYLVLSEPQLWDVLIGLSTVRPGHFPHDKLRWSKSVIAPLRALAEQMQPQTSDRREVKALWWGLATWERSGVPAFPGIARGLYDVADSEFTNRNSRMAWHLDFFQHPQFVLQMHRWDPRGFRRMLGGRERNYQEVSETEAVKWIEKHGDAMTRDYDLRQSPPLPWFEAFAAGDAAARRMLLRLWQYEDSINEAGLLEQATKGPFAEEAKLLLSDLWENKMLSPETRRAIVQDFVSYSLEIGPMEHTELPQLFVVRTKNFPFPPSTSVSYSYDCGVDRATAGKFDKVEAGNASLVGRDATRSWLSNVRDPTRSDVDVIIENWERDTTVEGGVLWRARWQLKWSAKKR